MAPHDAGTGAVDRDRDPAPAAAGPAEGTDPRAARTDPGERADERGSAEQVRQLQRSAPAGAYRRWSDPLTGTASCSSSRTRRSRSRQGADQADYLVGARDLRSVVEELWAAGAEAVAIDGERMTPTSAVIDVGPVRSRERGGDPGRPVSGLRHRPGRLTDARLSRLARLRRSRSGREPRGSASRVSFAEPEAVDIPRSPGPSRSAMRVPSRRRGLADVPRRRRTNLIDRRA